MNNQSEKVSYTFVVSCALFLTCLLLSNLIAGKIAIIAGAILPAAVILFPVTYILGDIFTEVYGFKRAKMVIWLGFICNLLAVVVYMITVALPYPDYWRGQEAFAGVLGTTPRILLASLLGYIMGEFSNAVILSKLKVKMNGKLLWVRTIASSIVGEAFDTVIFISISFWGSVDKETLFSMMCFQYLWKICYEVIMTPVTYAVVNFLKKKERLDVYDRGIRYRLWGLGRIRGI